MNSFKEALLLKHFPEKSLNALYHGLYDTLIRNLANYTRTTSLDMQCHAYLEEIEILFKKKLYEPCFKIIEKGLAFTKEYELYHYLGIFDRWYRHVQILHFGISHSSKDDFVFEKIYKHTELYVNSWRLGLLVGYCISNLQRIAPSNTKERFRFIKKLLQHKELKGTKPPTHTSSMAKQNFYLVHAIVHWEKGNKEESLSYFIKAENVIAQVTHRTFDIINTQIGAINNILRCAHVNHDKTLLIKYSNKLLLIIEECLARKDGKSILERVVSKYFIVQLIFFNNTGEARISYQLLHNHDERFEPYLTNMTTVPYVMYNYQRAYTFFLLKDYDKALKILQELLEFENLKRLADYHYCIRVLELIIFVEQDYKLLLLPKVRSLYRFIKKHREQFNFEQKLFTLIRKNTKETLQQDDFKRLIESLKDEQNIMKKELRVFDLFSWVEAKAMGKDFQLVLQEKQKERMQKSNTIRATK